MERRLAAILCADVHGYSRLMGDNEEATVQTLSAHRKIIDNLIEQHHGRFVVTQFNIVNGQPHVRPETSAQRPRLAADLRKAGLK